MEQPTNLMMVTGILMFEERLDPARLRRVIEERLLLFPRFRQHIEERPFGLGMPQWVTAGAFDLDAHLHHIALPGPAGKAELEALVSDLVSTPLDPGKPLWQLHLVDSGAGSVLIARIHHAIADGIALIRVLLSLTDTTARPPKLPAGESVHAERDRGLVEWVKAGTWLAQAGFGLLGDPSRAASLLGKGAGAAAELARATLLPPDPKTSLKGELGVRKRAAWSEPIDLDKVKAAGKRAGATVNDVLVTAMAGALRRYLRSRGDNVDGLEIRAGVPVNLRPLEEAHRLGNAFGLALLPLPVGVAGQRQRLVEVKRRMDEIKASMQPVVALGMLALIGSTPAPLQPLAIDFFTGKISCVLTNVAGPRQQLYLAGRKLRRSMFWVPQSGQVGLGLSILSYAGEVMVGVTSDSGLVPDPHQLVTGFEAELARLVRVRTPRRPAAAQSK